MSSRYGRSIPNFFSNRDFTSGDYEVCALEAVQNI
jgi:hypothetical protein